MLRKSLAAPRAVRRGFSTLTRQKSFQPRFEPLEARHLLSATVIEVDTFDDLVDPDDGVTSLREAVLTANASPDDYEIRLSPGTYALTLQGVNENAAATGNLNIRDNGSLFIRGAGAAATTIDAQGLAEGPEFDDGDGIFSVDGGVLRLAKVTLTDGLSTRGGAIYNDGGEVGISSAALHHNSAQFGGGVYNTNDGRMTIFKTALSENSASGSGGAVCNDGSSEVIITGSTFWGNSADDGGAIVNSRGHLTLNSSTVASNTATSNGGGIGNYDQLTVVDSTISGNDSIGGGGVFTHGDVTITGSTISANTADYGGGIFNWQDIVVRHSTIIGNRARGALGLSGGGLLLFGASETTLEYTIVAGNVQGPAPGGTPNDIESQSHNSTGSYNLVGDPLTAGGLVHGVDGNIVGDGAGNLLDINTVLDTTLADNGGLTLTHALVARSPAINAGDPAFDPNAADPPVLFDQRGDGFPRVVGPRLDIGAFEGAPDPVPIDGVIKVDMFEDSVAADGLLSLREAVIYANTHAGDFEIQLAAGTYALTLRGENEHAALTGDLDVLDNGSLKIVGAGAGTTIIDAAGLTDNTSASDDNRVFTILGAQFEMHGLTLTGGHADLGGAITNQGGQVTIDASALSNNLGAFGGAVHNRDNGRVTITNSTLSNNLSAVGGGIYNALSHLALVDSAVSGNTAHVAIGGGGGIYNVGILLFPARALIHLQA